MVRHGWRLHHRTRARATLRLAQTGHRQRDRAIDSSLPKRRLEGLEQALDDELVDRDPDLVNRHLRR